MANYCQWSTHFHLFIKAGVIVACFITKPPINLNYTSHKSIVNILLTKTTAAQNEVALSYHSVRGLYFLAVVFVATIVILITTQFDKSAHSST